MQVSATTWSTLSKLLDEALDLEPQARAVWFEQLSATQPALAPSVRRLLAAHASSETADVLARLPTLSAAGTSTRVSALAPGDRIGPYRLKREIGAGGMADVWLAERADGAFTREVALKLPLINRLRRDLAQRFARERDILARLEHPHIARLYDAGVTEDGLPYLAMEYVDGLPFTAYCDAHRLNVRQRLDLFSQILDAVQYAHAHLVIHRDLKPSNILVTAEGQVRLLDFGIAKLLADSDTAQETLLTELSGRALTPDYASPEQIKGAPLTIATDIYSLGVLLYELLAGQRPYRLAIQSAAQLEQAIVNTDPRSPSGAVTAEAALVRGEHGLARVLAGDLDTIVLKALAKVSLARYATIAEFADDLRRYLAGKPVQARPASWRYRVRKFVGRNRVAVGAAGAIGVALVAATIVSLWQARLAQQQAERTTQVKNFVVSIFADADPDLGGSRATTAVELLKQARERLAAQQVNDRAIALEMMTAVGSSLLGLGEYKQAVEILVEATAEAGRKLDADHPNIVAARLALGEALLKSDQTERSESEIEAAEVGMRRLENMPGLVRALRLKSELRQRAAKREESVALATDAVRLAETHLALTHKRELMEAYSKLWKSMSAAGQNGRLEPARRAYEVAREIYGDRLTNPLLRTRLEYAFVMAEEGSAEAALAEMKEVLQQQVRLLGANHDDVAQTLNLMGHTARDLGDPNAAIDNYREALRIRLALEGDRSSYALYSLRASLGRALATARRLPEAESELRRAHAIYAQSDPKHIYVRSILVSIASVLVQQGRLEEAEAMMAPVLAVGSPNSELGAAVMNRTLIALRSAQGRHIEAKSLALEGERFWSGQPRPIMHAGALAALGATQLHSGGAAEALASLQRSEALYQNLHSRVSPDRADVLMNLGRAQLALGQNDDAIVETEKAVAFWTSFDPLNRSTGIALLWHARAAAAAGNEPKGREALGQAAVILANAGLPADQVLLKEAQRELRGRKAPPQAAHRSPVHDR